MKGAQEDFRDEELPAMMRGSSQRGRLQTLQIATAGCDETPSNETAGGNTRLVAFGGDEVDVEVETLMANPHFQRILRAILRCQQAGQLSTCPAPTLIRSDSVRAF